MKTYQVHLCFNVVAESFHGNSSYSHGVPNHHACNRDDISGSEREHAQYYQQEHSHRSSSENGSTSHTFSTRDMFGTLTCCIASNRHLQGKKII